MVTPSGNSAHRNMTPAISTNCVAGSMHSTTPVVHAEGVRKARTLIMERSLCPYPKEEIILLMLTRKCLPDRGRCHDLRRASICGPTQRHWSSSRSVAESSRSRCSGWSAARQISLPGGWRTLIRRSTRCSRTPPRGRRDEGAHPLRDARVHVD